MRIFSNFDTRFQEKLIAEKRKTLGDMKIHVIERSKYYLYFKVIPHFAGYVGVLLTMLVFLSYVHAFNSIFVVFIFVWLLIVWFRIGHKLLKYFYDFTLVTSKGIITYKQKGILRNHVKEIPAARITTVQVSKQGILGNVFGYGFLDIMADTSDTSSDTQSPGVTGLTYVDAPLQVKSLISHCCFK